jgi:hypothetical protein
MRLLTEAALQEPRDLWFVFDHEDPHREASYPE